MLKTKSMTHLLITGLKERLEPTIQELYLQHAFHVREYVEGKDPDYEGFVLGKPLPGAGSVSGDLVRLRGVLSLLGIDPRQASAQERPPKAGEIAMRMERDLPALEKEVEDLVTRRRDALEPRIHGLEEEIAALTPFAAAPLDLDLYRGYSAIVVFAGRIGHDVNIPVSHEKFFAAAVEGNFLALFVRVEDRAKVEGILQEARFQPLAIPEGSGSPSERLAASGADLASAKREVEEIDRRLGEIRREHEPFFLASEEILSTLAEQYEVPLRFATSEGAFVAEGWVPTAKVKAVTESVERATGGKVYVSEIELGHDEKEIPVEYENPSFAQPTELITDLHSRPRYSEVDPTLTVAIIFPIFFGIILGDVGYGALLLAVALALPRIIPSKEGAKMGAVLRNCSISAIIFGILFSEFFGFEMPWHPVLPSRHLLIGAVEAGGEGPNIVGLIVFAVWIAIAQLTLGRVLSAINKSHDPHHGMKGVLGQIGWIATMFGILFLLWSIFPIPYMPDLTGFPPVILGLSIPVIIGAVLLLGGLALIANESALELIELPTIISNGMSYARLAAVGLSSVVIAIVINYIAIDKLIEPSLENLTILGVVLILVGIAVLVGGHLLNTALGLIGGGLQSLRLQYVEYFTKFYKGGGKKYRPFGKEMKFSED
jgi:V/A-type H+/Na+-transporting ATPase subunit I